VELVQRVFLKRLRVFSTLIVALGYCVRNVGHLFVLVWFVCALNAACRTGLEWLIYGPPRMPPWLIFHGFDPPSWLTPLLSAPLLAMAWAFVLSHICDRNPNRGVIAVFERRLDWIRFELSRPVLLGASIFLAMDLLDGVLQITELRLLLAVYEPSEGSDFVINLAALFGTTLRTVVLSLVAAWTYPIAAQALWMGKLDRALLGDEMRGNRLRLWAIFLLLNVALFVVGGLFRLAEEWFLGSSDPPISWSLRDTMIRRVIQFPFDVLSVVAWATTTAVAMKALASEPAAAELGRRATRPA
jgi:hypothetical protein